MADIVEIRIPNIGDFKNVEVIEVLVSPGDSVEPEQSLITLESDKATLEIPAPTAGVIRGLTINVGDKVSAGNIIGQLEPMSTAPAPGPDPRGSKDGADASSAAPAGAASSPASRRQPASTPGAARGEDLHTEVLVLGGGPGGYTAAFRAADLGKQVVLVERYPTLGGVCLNVGCIPSKALLHVAALVNGSREMADHGLVFGAPRIDTDPLRAWKNRVVGRLTGGLNQLAKQRKVQVIQGVGRFFSGHRLAVERPGGELTVNFDHAIIAVGSRVTKLPGIPYEDPRVMDSTDALELAGIPGRLLVIGGGIIGLEMATVYDALGSRVSVVELTDGLIPGCDPDLVRPLQRRIAKRYEAIYTGTRVTAVEARPEGIRVAFEGPKAPAADTYDRVLVAVGRQPNGREIGAENAEVHVDERGFIPVDRQQRTNVTNIFAIGDVVGQPMLAHKAVHEAKVAAEVITGQACCFDARAIPNVAYTDPEVAWMGLSETEAKARGIEVEKAVFPWAASGRSLGMGRDEGLTKLLFDKSTGRLAGAGIVGPHAGDLIAETVLALEMGADAQDIGLSIHPHPTLSETIAFAAEMAEGTITDLYIPKRQPG